MDQYLLYAEMADLCGDFTYSSLAYMEMYMAIAYLVRRFDLTLFNTTAKDMQWDDMVVPQFHGEFQVRCPSVWPGP